MSDNLSTHNLTPGRRLLGRLDAGERPKCAVCGKWVPDHRRLYCSRWCSDTATRRRKEGRPINQSARRPAQPFAVDVRLYRSKRHGRRWGVWIRQVESGNITLESRHLGWFERPRLARAFAYAVRADVRAGRVTSVHTAPRTATAL